MKIYKQEPLYFVRLQIVKQGEETKYLTLVDTTMDDVEDMVKNIVISQNVSPFDKGKITSVNIREAWGGKNGKSQTVSFKGVPPQKLYDLITLKLSV